MEVIESLSIKIIHSWAASPMRINKDLIVWIQWRRKYFSKVLRKMTLYVASYQHVISFENKYNMPLHCLGFWKMNLIVTGWNQQGFIRCEEYNLLIFLFLYQWFQKFLRLKTKHKIKFINFFKDQLMNHLK